MCFLLLFGYLPKKEELNRFCEVVKEMYELPYEFLETNILRTPAKNLMNKIQHAVLALYNYDEEPDDIDEYKTLIKGVNLIAKMPSIICYESVSYTHLDVYKRQIEPYRDAPIFANIFAVLGRNPLLGILAGALVTAIIQSSSASVGILQTLALNGVVNWQSAIFITLGQNIGTCITAILSSVGAHRTAKRAAAIHLSFNVVGAIIFGILMTAVFAFNPDLAASPISSVEISIFHTVFNEMCIRDRYLRSQLVFKWGKRL